MEQSNFQIGMRFEYFYLNESDILTITNVFNGIIHVTDIFGDNHLYTVEEFEKLLDQLLAKQINPYFH